MAVTQEKACGLGHLCSAPGAEGMVGATGHPTLAGTRTAPTRPECLTTKAGEKVVLLTLK